MSQAMLSSMRLTPSREMGGDPDKCWWCDDPRPPDGLSCSPDCDHLLRVWWSGHSAGIVTARSKRPASKRPPWVSEYGQ